VEGRGGTPLSDIAIGDRVLALHSGSVLGFEPVVSFLHRDIAAAGSMLEVLHVFGVLQLSEKHLVFVLEDGAFKSRLAGHLEAGDAFQAHHEGELVESVILAVRTKTSDGGIYAPLTYSGTLLVDGVVASNYASPSVIFLPHGAAHAAFFPARVLHSLVEGSTTIAPPANFMHPLAKLYLALGLQRLASWAGRC